MEEDIYQRLASPLARTKTEVKVEDRLQAAIEVADNRLKYESAHDELLLGALSIVEKFIIRKKRVCYGGTAMNEILPDAKKFYDPRIDVPDYDFYTPDVDSDVKELVEDLNAAGYKDVYHKVGIHEGTKKILVNFVPIADISAINSELFTVLLRRSVLKNGMHYTDPDILRMMMFLELSRPKGMVSRWNKVFERLQLINQVFPIKGCKGYRHEHLEPTIPMDLRKAAIDYCIQQRRILCNGDLAGLYERGIRRKNTRFKLQAGGPVLMTSPDPRADAKILKIMFNQPDIRMYLHASRGEIVPMRVELRKGDLPICMFVEETACHSYNPFSLDNGKKIHVASLEFLITLHLSLDIFTHNSRDYLGDRGLCNVKQFMDLYEKNSKALHSQFPPFTLTCSGHQVGFASLLRKKVERIKHEKGATESIKVSRSKTHKRSGTKRSGHKRSGTHKRSVKRRKI